MMNKPYTTRAQFTGWTTEALLDEIARIEKLKLDLDITPTPHSWKAGKKHVGQKVVELRRMKEDSGSQIWLNAING
ncbi:hypothetical protein HanRHA438_Chr06g0260741 [Helianthus annuus]|nr:hypothetical protein HanRHA438_Chr06g0260741 [Helianthus annuus]